MKKIKEFWNKGKKQKAIVIVVAFLIIGSISTALTQNQDNSNIGYNLSENENLTLDLNSHNDSNAIDQINSKVKDDLKNNSKEKSTQIINDGLFFIKNNINNLTKDNVTMEKVMYYGYYIYNYIEENSGAKNVSELDDKERAVYTIGYNAYTYVKYPYRGIEGSDDKLEEIKECLNKI